jgi:Leucine-rich repeat (LRR) protein
VVAVNFREPKLKHLILSGLLLCFAFQAFAANKFSDSRVTLDTPLSAEDVSALRALKTWPATTVQLDRAAADDVLESLAQVPEIRSLSFSHGNARITSLSPLARLSELSSLDVIFLKLPSGEPLSVAPLARCTALTRVNFQGTPITAVDALRACVKLQDVSFSSADVDSLAFLAATPAVESLSLYGSEHTFASYEPVSKLSRLTELNISVNTQANDADLAVLARLTTLRKVSMVNSRRVTSLGFLANNHDMDELDAKWSAKLTDVGAIGKMPYLTKVDLGRTGIRDLRVFAGKVYLTHLDVSETAVADLSPLKDSLYLETLNLSETAVVDIAPLAEVRMLRSLDLSKTRVSDITPLKSQRRLQGLDLDNSAVTDLSPLAGLLTLQNLSLDRTAVADLTPLHGLRNLREITLSRIIPDAQIEALKQANPKLSVRLR